MEDVNLDSLLITAEFVLLFKRTLEGRGSKKTFYPKRLKRVKDIVNSTEKGGGEMSRLVTRYISNFILGANFLVLEIIG